MAESNNSSDTTSFTSFTSIAYEEKSEFWLRGLDSWSRRIPSKLADLCDGVVDVKSETALGIFETKADGRRLRVEKLGPDGDGLPLYASSNDPCDDLSSLEFSECIETMLLDPNLITCIIYLPVGDSAGFAWILLSCLFQYLNA
jgi:hypothetical protein